MTAKYELPTQRAVSKFQQTELSNLREHHLIVVHTTKAINHKETLKGALGFFLERGLCRFHLHPPHNTLHAHKGGWYIQAQDFILKFCSICLSTA